MSTIRFARVRRAERDGTWFVDIGHEEKRLWWKSKVWDRYVTKDDGNTWATMDETAGYWFPGYMVDPTNLKTIDVLWGVLLPYLRAVGKTQQAAKLSERQEEYWKRCKWAREQAEAAIQGRASRAMP